MLNIGVSLIIFLYVTAVCLFALYFILKISFKEKRLQGDDDFIQDFIKKQDERIKDRGINFSTKMYFRIMFTAPFILGIVFFFVLDGSYMCLLCAALGLVLPEFFLYIITNNSKKKFDERFAKSLKQLSSSLRAGMSIVQAVDDVANCTLLHDSMRKKYAQISSDIMMGITVGEAFRRFADGTGSPDAQDVAIALDVQNEVGGHEAEVVQEIADNIHERIMTRQEIKSIFSSTTSMAWIMDFIPIGVILFFSITNKSYVDVFFGNYIYTGILIGMIIMMIIGSIINHILVRKIGKGE